MEALRKLRAKSLCAINSGTKTNFITLESIRRIIFRTWNHISASSMGDSRIIIIRIELISSESVWEKKENCVHAVRWLSPDILWQALAGGGGEMGRGNEKKSRAFSERQWVIFRAYAWKFSSGCRLEMAKVIDSDSTIRVGVGVGGYITKISLKLSPRTALRISIKTFAFICAPSKADHQSFSHIMALLMKILVRLVRLSWLN